MFRCQNKGCDKVSEPGEKPVRIVSKWKPGGPHSEGPQIAMELVVCQECAAKLKPAPRDAALGFSVGAVMKGGEA